MATYLTVHGGHKVAAAYCLSRLPLVLQEAAPVQDWRAWRAAWEKRTLNDPVMDDALVYMRLPTHFLPLPGANKANLLGGASPLALASSSNAKEIDFLTASEGFAAPAKSSKASSKSKLLAEDGKKMSVSSVSAARDFEDVRRLPERMLHLIVKYRAHPSVWTFPWGHRRSDDSMTKTLRRITAEHLQTDESSTYLLNACPVGFRKVSGSARGTKLFYYRGWWVDANGDKNVALNNELVSQFAWVTKEELANLLPTPAFSVATRFLPLEDNYMH